MAGQENSQQPPKPQDTDAPEEEREPADLADPAPGSTDSGGDSSLFARSPAGNPPSAVSPPPAEEEPPGDEASPAVEEAAPEAPAGDEASPAVEEAAPEEADGEQQPAPAEEEQEPAEAPKQEASKPKAEGLPTVPGYEIIRIIGRGGSGKVYLARQVSMDRLVALKLLDKKLITDEGWVDRFLKTARYTGRLNHPNIVIAHDCGTHEDTCYLAMELVDGMPLSRKLKKQPRLDEKTTLEIIAQMAEALHHSHMAGLVHRDIKPGNILLTRDGRAKLTDLGLAKWVGASEDSPEAKEQPDSTGRFMIVGTPKYIAPEQAMGRPNADIRADIYSLGITMFQMLAGKHPFEGTNKEVMIHHIKTPCSDVREFAPDVSERTAAIVSRMTKKNPKDRYQNPEELLAEAKLALREVTEPSDSDRPVGLPGEPMHDEVPENLLFGGLAERETIFDPSSASEIPDEDADLSSAVLDSSPTPESTTPMQTEPVAPDEVEEPEAEPEPQAPERPVVHASRGLFSKRLKQGPAARYVRRTEPAESVVGRLRGTGKQAEAPAEAKEPEPPQPVAVPVIVPPTPPTGKKTVFVVSTAAKELTLKRPPGSLKLKPINVVGDEIVLCEGLELILGRELQSCDVVVADPRSSRRHCGLKQAGRNVTLRDFESRNGTFHEEQQVVGSTTMTVGEHMRIGHTIFQLTG